jgi:tetratricopeptide (TPR) repeat protein
MRATQTPAPPRLRKIFRALAGAALLLAASVSLAQEAPTTIQIFMPSGARPDRELRFTLTRDDGRIEILFTDSKGRFALSGGLRRDGEYTVTVESDGRTFATTTTRFRQLRSGVNYVTVFLLPYKGDKVTPAGTVDLNELDAAVPAAAREEYRLAMKAVDEARADEAVAHFRRAVEIFPRYLRALTDLGVLYLRLERLEEAGDVLRRAVRVSRRFHYARFNLGLVLNRQGKFGEAAEVFGPLHGEDPRIEGLVAAYADALAGAGQTAEAEKLLRAAKTAEGLSEPARTAVRYKLGVLLSRAGRFAEAVPELEEAVRLDERAANAHLLLGGALLELKRFPEAERELLRAYELGRAEAGSAQLLLGQLYLSQQKLEPALRAYEQYLTDVPAAPSAEKVRQVIAKLKQALKQS